MIKKNKLLRVLMADDDEEDRNLLKIAFEEIKSPCKLDFVCDGVELMEYLNQKLIQRTDLPDLILLDLNMPKKDGKTALRNIKADPSLKDIYVIIFSTSNSPEDKKNLLSLGANNYYVKPPDYSALLEMIRKIQNELIYSLKMEQE